MAVTCKLVKGIAFYEGCFDSHFSIKAAWIYAFKAAWIYAFEVSASFFVLAATADVVDDATISNDLYVVLICTSIVDYNLTIGIAILIIFYIYRNH